LFTNFSLLPLQFITAWGFLAAAGGLALGCYYLVYYILYGIDVPGYASIIIAVLVLGGMQLLSLGIMGDYLGRLHLNVNRKPEYVEREVLTATPAVTVVNITGPQVRAASCPFLALTVTMTGEAQLSLRAPTKGPAATPGRFGHDLPSRLMELVNGR